jgi:hypothetical protein
MVSSRPSHDLTRGGGASLDGMSRRRVGAGSTDDEREESRGRRCHYGDKRGERGGGPVTLASLSFYTCVEDA